LRNDFVYITLTIEKSKNQVSIRGFKIYRDFNDERNFLPEGEGIESAVFGDLFKPVIIAFDTAYCIPKPVMVYIVFTAGGAPLAFIGMISL
jgi:hypothetical protein